MSSKRAAHGRGVGEAIVGALEIGRRTRPRPHLRLAHEPGPDRGQQHVAEAGGEMVLVHHRSTIAALPEMSGAAAALVQRPGIAAVHGGKCGAKAVLGRGNEDGVDVVGGEREGEAFDAGHGAAVGEECEVELIVGVGEEHLGTTIAALGDVVREAGDDDAGEAGHGGRSSRGLAVWAVARPLL